MKILLLIICIGLIHSFTDAASTEGSLFKSYNYPTYHIGIWSSGQACIRNDDPYYFKLISPGLSGGENSISFQSVSEPNKYLKTSANNYNVWLAASDNTEVYKKDASFKPRKDHFYAGYTTFESVNWPGYFIRHYKYGLKVAKDSGYTLMHKDASYRIIPPTTTTTLPSVESPTTRSSPEFLLSPEEAGHPGETSPITIELLIGIGIGILIVAVLISLIWDQLKRKTERKRTQDKLSPPQDTSKREKMELPQSVHQSNDYIEPNQVNPEINQSTDVENLYEAIELPKVPIPDEENAYVVPKVIYEVPPN